MQRKKNYNLDHFLKITYKNGLKHENKTFHEFIVRASTNFENKTIIVTLNECFNIETNVASVFR